MLNGRRVDVRHKGFILYAVNGEASKKLVSIVFYGNHNYDNEFDLTAYWMQVKQALV